jgi:hypothetical protein
VDVIDQTSLMILHGRTPSSLQRAPCCGAPSHLSVDFAVHQLWT